MKELGTIKFGDVSIKVLSNSDLLTVAELYFPSGVAAAIHHHFNEEVNYVVKGKFETIQDGIPLILEVGDVLQVSSNSNHNLKCISSEDGIVLTAWAPSRIDIISKLTENDS